MASWHASRAYHRNVVVVGKTGSGKSSVCNEILGSGEGFTVSSSFKSCTKSVSFKETSIRTRGGTSYNVTVFDTVGLFDTGKLKDKKIMDEVQEYAQKYAPTGIHLVLFVMSKSRFTREEKQAFDYISSRLGRQMHAVSALVITHCDEDDDEEREEIIESFKKENLTNSMARSMHRGIYCVGFPDRTKMKPKLYEAMKDDIAADRMTILNLIVRSTESEFANELKKCTLL